MRLLLATPLLLSLLAPAREAAAQSGAEVAVEVAFARTLFEEATELVRQGYLWRAIPKLEASIGHDPTPAAMLALADCQRRMGATATAWGWFHRAEERARSLGDTARAAEAAEQAAAIEARIPRVKVVVAEGERPPDIRLDGRPLATSALGIAIPVDPGEHKVVATAPGRVPFEARINADKGGGTVLVAIPVLGKALTVPGPSRLAPEILGEPSAASPASSGSGAKVLMIVGGVALGLAVVSGLSAYAVITETDRESPGRTAGWVLVAATVPLALVGGGMLFLGNRTWRNALPPLRFRAGPFVAGTGAGLGIQGTF